MFRITVQFTSRSLGNVHFHQTLGAILTRNRVSSWFTLLWSDVPPLANGHVHICEPRAQQHQSLREAARRAMTHSLSSPLRNTDVPRTLPLKCACGNTELHLTRWTWAQPFPQRWQERLKRWTGDAPRVHLPKHLRIEFSRSLTRCWGECSVSRTAARQYWACNHYAQHIRHILFPIENFVWCALEGVYRLLLITSLTCCYVQLRSLKWGIECVRGFSACVGVCWCNALISCVFQWFLHALPAVTMIYAWWKHEKVTLDALYWLRQK